MKFIAENTQIPVPKVICAFVHKSVTYIVMERIPGKMLAAVWPSLSESSRTNILSQLKSMVNLMRELKPPEGFEGVANASGGPLSDLRLPRTDNGFGPFETIQQFHKFLRNGLEKLPDLNPEIKHMIDLHDGPWPGPVFTHGDLSSLNILVAGNNIVGIIDWETAGWFPNYWEYTTAHQVNAYNLFWKDQIDQFLEPMPKELAMDQTRNINFGDVCCRLAMIKAPPSIKTMLILLF
jgi:aminoglycoside phosphotransferase (APT) family kinase protein